MNLIDAVKNGNVHDVLISMHQVKNEEKASIIELALKKRDYNITSILFESGYDLTPKMLKEIIKRKRAKEVNFFNRILAHSITSNNEELSKFIIENVETEAKNILVKAVKDEDIVKINKLLSLGINPNFIHKNCYLFKKALDTNNIATVKLLLHYKADVNMFLKEPFLFYEIITDKYEKIVLLLKAGIDLKQKINGENVLDIFSKYTYSSRILHELLKYGASEYGKADKPSFLHLYLSKAKSNAFMREILTLLSHEDPNIKDRYGDTALILAAWRNRPVKVMFETFKNLDIDVKNNDKETALYWAVRKNNIDNVKILLEHNADFGSLQDPKSAIHLAKTSENYEIVSMFIDKISKKDTIIKECEVCYQEKSHDANCPRCLKSCCNACYLILSSDKENENNDCIKCPFCRNPIEKDVIYEIF